MPEDRPGGAESPQLISMFQDLLRKTQQVEKAQPPPPTTISITFDGGATAVTAGLGGVVQLSFPCRLLSATMYAGSISTYGVVPTPVTATIWLGLGRRGTWARGAREIFNPDIPSLTLAEEAELDISGWVTDFQPNDVIAYSLQTFVGTATFVCLELVVKRLDVSGIGVLSVTEGASNVTDDSDTVTVR